MSEIKFRQYIPKAGRFHYWGRLSKDEFVCPIGEAHLVEESQQYVGLKDKNGVEIYKGDIVRGFDVYDEMPVKGYVSFQDASFVIRNDIDGIPLVHYRWMDYDIEVVGNIYENGELL